MRMLITLAVGLSILHWLRDGSVPFAENFPEAALACQPTDIHFTSFMEAGFSITFWLSIRSGALNLVAQFHLVELMRDFSSLAAFTFGGDMQILTCFKFSLVADSFGSAFPAREQKEVDRVSDCINSI